jgi:transposase
MFATSIPSSVSDAETKDLNPSIEERDIDAVRNGIEMQWSNGQAEGRINRLKTLKRAMFGRAGPNLLRARMLPRHHTN